MSNDTNLAQQILAWIKHAEEESQAPRETSYERAVDRQSVLVQDIENLCKNHIAANVPMRQQVMVYDEDRLRAIVRDEINKCQERMVRDLRTQGGTRIR